MPNQREVVEVNFLLPDNSTLKHPVIVISNSQLNAEQGGFTGIMMTSSRNYEFDPYSFEVDDSMFTKPMPTDSGYKAIRVNLISTFPNSHILSNSKGIVYMKPEPFDRMLVEMNERNFGFI